MHHPLRIHLNCCSGVWNSIPHTAQSSHPYSLLTHTHTHLDLTSAPLISWKQLVGVRRLPGLDSLSEQPLTCCHRPWTSSSVLVRSPRVLCVQTQQQLNTFCQDSKPVHPKVDTLLYTEAGEWPWISCMASSFSAKEETKWWHLKCPDQNRTQTQVTGACNDQLVIHQLYCPQKQHWNSSWHKGNVWIIVG